MSFLTSTVADLATQVYSFVAAIPIPLLLLALVVLLVADVLGAYLLLHWIAPKPRLPYPSEKTYQTSAVNENGKSTTTTVTRQLPCWYDQWLVERHLAMAAAESTQPMPGSEDDNTAIGLGCYDLGSIQAAEVGLTVVVPAYNEAERILPALEEMVEYCEQRFGKATGVSSSETKTTKAKTNSKKTKTTTQGQKKHEYHYDGPPLQPGYEILVVNDASSDNTVQVVLDFAARRGLHDVVRVVSLERNRGKGGGVTHGFRHARGAFVVFADADGASRFRDLDRLLEGCDVVVDASGRGVAIGSRGHLVGSEAVVRRSALRNFLMKSFHFVLMILTPPATSRLRDTQCGFKLFSRAALPHIVPYMHTEGWIFDIEMLMLAESAPSVPVLAHDGTVIGASAGIKVAEVPIHWHEVQGSKMNLVQDSIRMAIGLTVLRASWMFGVYRRRLA